MIVVDASVALKWFFNEADSVAADDLLDSHAGEMVMPELFMTEVLSGLVRAANIDAGQFEAVNRKVARFFALHRSATFAVRSALPVLERAAEIAFKLRHPIKDCVYLALAEALKVPFVTADLKFATKARLQFGFIETLAD